jgi:hypothetical protein
MKRVGWSVLIATLLVVMVVMPAGAAGGEKQVRWASTQFSLVGEVSAVEAATGTITVEVQTGNWRVKSYVGQLLTVATDANTRFLLYSTEGCHIAAFEDVQVETYVSIYGYVSTADGLTQYMATRVTVGVPIHTEG